MSKAYSIYETKTHLSEILRMVKSGKEVIINERGRSVARILPFVTPRNLAERWNWLRQNGQILEAEDGERDFKNEQYASGALQRFLDDRNS